MVLFEFSDIADYYTAVKNFLGGLYDYIIGSFNVLPQPFSTMALSFVLVIMAIIILKILK